MARVFVITGPSGVGKGTLIRGLMERLPQLELSISATTRPPRAGERNGVDYHFLSQEEFERRVLGGRVLGACRLRWSPIWHLAQRAREPAAGRRAAGARDRGPGCPPDQGEPARGDPGIHRAALASGVARALDSARDRRPDEVERRLEVAREEIAAQPEFAHVIVNEDLQDALGQLVALIERKLSPDRPGRADRGADHYTEAEQGKATPP